MENIRKDLYLDQPKWKQFVLYLNDIFADFTGIVKPILKKQLVGFFVELKGWQKIPTYAKATRQKKCGQLLLESLPGTMILAFTAMLFKHHFVYPIGRCGRKKEPGWIRQRFSSIAGISAPSFFYSHNHSIPFWELFSTIIQA